MLTHLSWNQFFLAVGMFLLLYYPVVMLLFYRSAIRTFFAKALSSLRPSGQHSPAPYPQVMGAAAPDEIPLPTNTSELVVAPLSEAAHAAADLEAAPGPEEVMADLLQELRDLLEVVALNPAGKKDFCTLLRLITSRYSALIPDRLQDQVNRFLLEQTQHQFPFELMPADLASIWEATPDQA